MVASAAAQREEALHRHYQTDRGTGPGCHGGVGARAGAHDNARFLIRQLYETSIDLLPDPQSKTVTVRSVSSPHGSTTK